MLNCAVFIGNLSFLGTKKVTEVTFLNLLEESFNILFQQTQKLILHF